uniref:Gag-pol polyprotein n=1 Tax=Oryza sativa subsp. japonica TaxID=39947 RepID=Q94GR9_ORYSJ|nr:putative gag-pol polyprotein [Oryza sativa Japonica Group]
MSNEVNHVGKAPMFNGTNYSTWKIKMSTHLKAMSFHIWSIVDVGFAITGTPLTEIDHRNLQLNAQAMNALFNSLSQEEFDRVSNLETAYEIWNKLAEIHEGTSEYKDAKLHFLKIQYETFSMLPHESVNDMYGRLNVIVNDLKGLGANYTDLEVAQKMLRALPEKYETFVTMLINSDMSRMTPASLLGKINTNDMYKLKKKEIEEASPSKKCIALQAEVEDQSKSKVNEVNEDLEEEMVLLARRFNDLLGRRKERGRGSNSNRRKNRRPNKTLSNLRCFECGEKGHFASKCPSKDDDGDKSSKKKSGGYKLMKKLKKEGKKIEAFIGEWDSNEESSASSGSEEEGGDDASSKKKKMAVVAIKEAPSLFAPLCLMAKGSSKVTSLSDSESDDDCDDVSYDELVSMFEELHTYSEKEIVKFKALKKDHASLEVLYEELKTTHERLTISHEKLKEAHDNLLSTTQHGAHIDVDISCDLLDDSATCHIAHVASSSISTSCDNLMDMPSPCSSSSSCVSICDASLVVENNELKEQVSKLNKSLERCFKGKNTLDKILSEQRCILNKEGLGFIPKKGKKPSHHATRFVKRNGKYCSKCREVGHLVSDCPGSKPPKTCMFDSHYMLKKAHDGSIVARYVGSPILGGKKNAIWVPKALVSNLQGPKLVWIILAILGVFFLHDKSIVAELFKKFAKRAQNEFSCTLVKIRSDNGSEFKNTNIEDYCDDLGIKHELSATYSPQQNGVVERKNRTLIEMARTMLDEYGVSDSFWAEAINTACHAINRLYLHRLLKKTSYELIVGRKPNVAYFRVFGCKCYIYHKGVRLTKFESRCDKGFLLGYASNSKAYRVYNKNKGDEGLMRAMKNMYIGDVKPIEVEDKPSTSTQDEPSTSASSSQAQVEVEDEKAQDPPMPPRIHTALSKDHPIDQVLGDISKGVQTRSRVASICEHYSFVSCLEPKHVDETLCDPDWMNAMHEELNNFARNKVWTLIERPRDHNVIGTKWIFRNKQDENGLVVRNKTRLVAQGFTQVEGLDFGEIFAPMARLEAIRILFAFASCFDIKLFQMDVKSAFLNGEIAELVFVEQPPGFEDPKNPNHVYKLSKALYGLKQAPRAWYERLKDFLLSKDFKIGKVDTTLFTKIIGDDFFVCQIYVDDIIFSSTNEVFCKEFGDMMSREFEMSMIGELSFFLGLQIKQLKDGTFVSQTKYIKDLLKRFGLEDAKPIKTPMATNGHLDLDEGGKLVDLKLYRFMIGSLLYLTASRPDIMFSICMCARFQAAPKECHLVAYPKGAKFQLVGYSDSDYTGCKVDRKSTSGSCQMLAMPPRTRHGRRAPTPDPVSENEESSGDEYVQSDEDNMENVEGDEMEVSDDGDDNESGNGEDDEASDDGSPLDSSIQFVLNLRNAQQYTIFRHHDQFRRPNDCNDPRFHTRFQKSVYVQVYANKAFAKHKWISWRHIGETPEFENLQEMFRTVGIDRIVTMKQPFDEDLIRQFYATVWVSGDCDAMKWMLGTLRCSINRREFKELLHIRFNNGDDLHDEHTHNPFPIDHFSQFYEEGGRHTYGKVAGLRALPSVINHIVRATILPRCGNNDDIRRVAWHVIDAIMDGRRFDVINLMMKEIAISKGTIGQGIYYALYIMRLPPPRRLVEELPGDLSEKIVEEARRRFVSGLEFTTFGVKEELPRVIEAWVVLSVGQLPPCPSLDEGGVRWLRG